MDSTQNASFHVGQAKGQTEEKASSMMDKASSTANSAKDSMHQVLIFIFFINFQFF